MSRFLVTSSTTQMAKVMVKHWRSCGMHDCSSKTRIFLIVFLWTTSQWLERSRIRLPCGRNGWKMLILTNQLRFLITWIWDALNVHVNRAKLNLIHTEKCLNHVFPPEQLKNDQGVNNFTQRRLRGRPIWKDMLKTALKGFASWQTKRQSNFAKSQVLAWMITISRKRNLNQLE